MTDFTASDKLPTGPLAPITLPLPGMFLLDVPAPCYLCGEVVPTGSCISEEPCCEECALKREDPIRLAERSRNGENL